MNLSEKANTYQLKEIEYINFNKDYFYDIKNKKKEIETNYFINLTTEEIKKSISNLKMQLREYENTNYKYIQNKTMINLLLQNIKNLEIELNKRQ